MGTDGREITRTEPRNGWNENPGHNAPGKTMMNKTEKSVPNLQNIIKWKQEKY